jgi:prepilin-type N-terminal cleavage/methylation domain-containing protein
MSARKHAFTLIELLVVIAVVSLLIAVMIPSLQTVREQARRIRCSSNLKAIGMGLAAFANQNDEALPQPQYQTTDPSRGYVCYDQAAPKTPLQLAEVYSNGFLGDTASILYCPSFASEYSSYTATGTWGQSFVNNAIKAAYLYVPQRKERDAFGLPVMQSKPRFTDLAQGSPLVLDKLDTWENIPHQSSGGMARGINVLFVDSSVKLCNDKNVIDFHLWHPFGATSEKGPGSSDLAVRAILSSIRE